MKKFQLFIVVILLCAFAGSSVIAQPPPPTTSTVQVRIDQNGLASQITITSVSIRVINTLNGSDITYSKLYNNENIVMFEIPNDGSGTIIPDAVCILPLSITKHLKSYSGDWPNSNGIKTMITFLN